MRNKHEASAVAHLPDSARTLYLAGAEYKQNFTGIGEKIRVDEMFWHCGAYKIKTVSTVHP